MIGPMPICYNCKHYHPNDNDDVPMMCDAFPKGIPFEIVIGLWDHTKPVNGDHGIQFESA